MITKLSNEERVLVTGPQRSGTRIAAKIIANDLGYKYVDEDEFGVYDIARFLGIYEQQTNIVIQCPSMSRYAHLFNHEGTFIVFMMRDVAEIIASQKRINWTADKEERRRYGNVKDERPISVIKYDYWERVQKPMTLKYLEMNYNDLSTSHLWISKANRLKFTAKQTEL